MLLFEARLWRFHGSPVAGAPSLLDLLSYVFFGCGIIALGSGEVVVLAGGVSMTSFSCTGGGLDVRRELSELDASPNVFS